MYKLIAIDLDGTLLNNYSLISENSKEILKKLKIENNVEIVLTSGRTLDSIKNYLSDIDANKYIIAVNGGIIYDVQNDQNIYEKDIPKEKALKLLKICEENSISYSLYTDKTIVASALKHNVLYYYKENLKKK